MDFDLVHDCQSVYRLVLKAFSYPGRVQDIGKQSLGIDVPLVFGKPAMAVALTLLDGETSVHVEGTDEAMIARLTGCKVVAPELASFLFCLSDGNLCQVLEQATTGTLIDPHLGATVVVEVFALASDASALPLEAENIRHLVFRGPGVERENHLFIAEYKEPVCSDPYCSKFQWLEVREARNAEFPLGIDLILVDKDGRLAALPRTSNVVRAEA